MKMDEDCVAINADRLDRESHIWRSHFDKNHELLLEALPVKVDLLCLLSFRGLHLSI